MSQQDPDPWHPDLLESDHPQNGPPFRICVVGTGAIGGLVGIRLAASGHDVTFVDKGERLEAMVETGLRLDLASGESIVLDSVKATGNPSEVEPQDVVFLGVKAHQIPEVAPHLPALLGPETMVVSLQNGLPWWYFQRHGGAFEGQRIQALDPDGIIEKYVDPERVIGCVAYPAATVPEPGVIKHVEGNRFPVGELDGTESARCQMLFDLLTSAGFKSRVISDVRAEIWLKAWGTMSLNPLSALTHATMEEICRLPETRDLVVAIMTEAQTVAEKLGITFRVPIERRVAGAERVGSHKTSMLQDVEAGEELELDALMASVIELGRLTSTPTPFLESIYAATKLLERTYSTAGARVGLIPLKKGTTPL
jgi:2-dehydropantoate 2-reductase